METIVRVLLAGLGIIVLFLVVRWAATRFGRVDQGYVAPIRWFGSHHRIVDAGPYFLWPGEQIGPRLMVRQQEACLAIPEVYSHSGLPVTVTLRYSMYLSPHEMTVDDLYYGAHERRELQQRIIKDHLQDLVDRTSSPAASESPRAPDLSSVFDPFFGRPMSSICHQLKERVRLPLKQHGIMLTDDPIVIESLALPPQIRDAYQDLLESDFESTARFRFIQRVRAAAPGMSDLGLAQLYSAISGNAGAVRMILANGVLNPASLASVQEPFGAGSKTPSPTGAALPSTAGPTPSPVGSLGAAPEGNYQLTVADMASLKAAEGS